MLFMAEEEETPPSNWPAKHSLSKKWDAHPLIREQVRLNGRLLSWQRPEAVGVANKASVALNRFVLLILMEEWVSHAPTPKSPPIGWLRQEALLVWFMTCMLLLHGCKCRHLCKSKP